MIQIDYYLKEEGYYDINMIAQKLHTTKEIAKYAFIGYAVSKGWNYKEDNGFIFIFN